MISRHVVADVPPWVEYEVTDFGRSLEAILVLIQEWGREFKVGRLADEAEGELPASRA